MNGHELSENKKINSVLIEMGGEGIPGLENPFVEVGWYSHPLPQELQDICLALYAEQGAFVFSLPYLGLQSYTNLTKLDLQAKLAQAIQTQYPTAKFQFRVGYNCPNCDQSLLGIKEYNRHTCEGQLFSFWKCGCEKQFAKKESQV